MANQLTGDPYHEFRPRRGRTVPIVMSIVVLVGFTAMAWTMPAANWKWWDRLFLFAVGCGIAWFLTRFVGIVAVPDTDGLTVRNLFRRRRLEWAEILRVQFSGGSPWVYLDTTSAETIPVMAVQKADGEYGRQEAARMAALIEFHSGAVEPER